MRFQWLPLASALFEKAIKAFFGNSEKQEEEEEVDDALFPSHKNMTKNMFQVGRMAFPSFFFRGTIFLKKIFCFSLKINFINISRRTNIIVRRLHSLFKKL